MSGQIRGRGQQNFDLSIDSCMPFTPRCPKAKAPTLTSARLVKWSIGSQKMFTLGNAVDFGRHSAQIQNDVLY